MNKNKNNKPKSELNTETTDQISGGDAIDQASKIDAIKQLLFGENMQAYDSEFETLKKDLRAKKKDLDNLIEEVRNELLQNIDNLNTDLNIRITEIENSFNEKSESVDQKKVDRKLLGTLLMTLGEKISN